MADAPDTKTTETGTPAPESTTPPTEATETGAPTPPSPEAPAAPAAPANASEEEVPPTAGDAGTGLLGDLGDLWESDETEIDWDDHPDEELDDGHYQAVVLKAEIRTTKDGSAKMLSWELQNLTEPRKGKRFWKTSMLNQPVGVKIAKADIRMCRLKAPTPEALVQALVEARGTVLDIQVKTNEGENGKKYKNYYFNKYVRKEAPDKIAAASERKTDGASGGGGSHKEDDEIPF